MKNNFLKFIIDEKKKDGNYTHLFNISAAISYFPTLTNQIINEFVNCDEGVFDFFDEHFISDGELRKTLVCYLTYAEKKEKEKLKNIISTYLTSPTYQDEIKSQVLKTYDKENYKLSSFLLYDYYVYLETGEYKGLYTRVN